MDHARLRIKYAANNKFDVSKMFNFVEWGIRGVISKFINFSFVLDYSQDVSDCICECLFYPSKNKQIFGEVKIVFYSQSHNLFGPNKTLDKFCTLL